MYKRQVKFFALLFLGWWWSMVPNMFCLFFQWSLQNQAAKVLHHNQLPVWHTSSSAVEPCTNPMQHSRLMPRSTTIISGLVLFEQQTHGWLGMWSHYCTCFDSRVLCRALYYQTCLYGWRYIWLATCIVSWLNISHAIHCLTMYFTLHTE